jgi:hypothetical protein
MISCGYLQKLDVNVSSDIPKTFFILSNERLCQFRAHHPNEPVMVEMPIDVATKLKKVDSNRFILEISHMNLEGRITTWFLVCNDENDFHRWHDEILMEIEIHRFSKLSLPEIPIQEKHQELDPETLSQIISMISSKQRQEERNLAPIQSAIAILEAIQKREQGKGR